MIALHALALVYVAAAVAAIPYLVTHDNCVTRLIDGFGK